MNAMSMAYGFEPREPSRRVKGLLIVLALHALLGYALVSGVARKGMNLIKKPLVTVVIQEVILPPPPPPQSREIKAPAPLVPRTHSMPLSPQPELSAPPAISPVELSLAETVAPPKATAVVMTTPKPTPVPVPVPLVSCSV